MIHLDDADTDVLMEFHHISGMGDATVCHLRDMHQTILMDADINKGPEVGDVRHDAWQFHSLDEVVDGVYTGIELKLLYLLAWVATRFFQFFHDISEGGDAHLVSHISFDVDGLALLLIINKVYDGAVLILCHLFHDSVTLRVDGRIVERVLGARDAQETGTLLDG